MPPDDDYKQLFQRLDTYMNYIEEEIKLVETYPLVKRKKFIDTFMQFYEKYLDIRGEASKHLPDSFHNKVISSLEKIRKIAYERDDYIFEMRVNLGAFEDGLIEISYIIKGNPGKLKDNQLNKESRKILAKKCEVFFEDLDRTMGHFKAFCGEEVPQDIVSKRKELCETLRKEFDILIDDYKNLGPIEIVCIDGDMILDAYQLVKKMRNGKKKEEALKNLNRMHEIYMK